VFISRHARHRLARKPPGRFGVTGVRTLLLRIEFDRQCDIKNEGAKPGFLHDRGVGVAIDEGPTLHVVVVTGTIAESSGSAATVAECALDERERNVE
jgi:hypothetical protein